MLRIRLRRVGKKKKPMYRIVVADSHAPRDGAFVENLGYYHPLDNPSTIVLDEERAKHWLGKGAIPSDRVAKILQIQGVADVSQKLAARIALGEQRKAEAAAAAKKAGAGASEAEADASAKAETPTQATAGEPKAEAPAEPAAKAGADASAKAETPTGATAGEPKAEAPAEPAAKEASAEDKEKSAE